SEWTSSAAGEPGTNRTSRDSFTILYPGARGTAHAEKPSASGAAKTAANQRNGVAVKERRLERGNQKRQKLKTARSTTTCEVIWLYDFPPCTGAKWLMISASLAPCLRYFKIAAPCDSGTPRRTSSSSVNSRTPAFFKFASDAPLKTGWFAARCRATSS